MEHPAGEADDGALRVDFDRRLKLEFHGSHVTSDAGLLAYRELDDALGLSELAGAALSECRQGKNTRHLLTGLFRQSVFGRVAGYEDVNDAERLAYDPAMRAVVDRAGLDRQAASTSQMGRFETGWLTSRAVKGRRAPRCRLGGPHLRSNGERIAGCEASGGVEVLSTLQSAVTCGYRPPKMPALAGHMGNVGSSRRRLRAPR
jgi:hypothetical protein